MFCDVADLLLTVIGPGKLMCPAFVGKPDL